VAEYVLLNGGDERRRWGSKESGGPLREEGWSDTSSNCAAEKIPDPAKELLNNQWFQKPANPFPSHHAGSR